MKISEAKKRLQEKTQHDAWIRRVNIRGTYAYEGGVGNRELASGCDSLETCYANVVTVYGWLKSRGEI